MTQFNMYEAKTNLSKITKMLENKDAENVSVKLYDERLKRTITQCELRMTDIRDQLSLIFALKKELEETSFAIRT